MKITSYNNIPYIGTNNQKSKSQKSDLQDSPNDKIKYLDISFAGLNNITPKKKNIEQEKHKLQKQINEILSTDVKDSDLDDMIMSSLSRALGKMRASLKRKKEILEELEALKENRTMSLQQKADIANRLRKEHNLLKKDKLTSKPQSKTTKTPDEKIDYKLVNKFKQAISENEFDLKKVYDQYYSDLRNIKTVEELNKKYPKIKTPANPRYVIAKKIESTLTRDFYEDIDDLFVADDKDKIFDYINGKVIEIVSQIAKTSKVDEDYLYNNIAPSLCRIIIDRFSKIKLEGSFNSVPEFRKNKTPQITDTDLKLLSLDFDDFVLSVVRSLYLDSKKLNDIVYSNGSVSVPAGMLKDSEYKFEKVSEKIKKLISSAENIKQAQRDYKNFDKNELKNRLNYYVSKDMSNNEELLGYIINFDSCLFTKEDIEPMIRFLQELDMVYDGQKTLEQALETIRKDDLKPRGTERQNEIERKQLEQKYKEEQKRIFELNRLKEEFDEAVNILYANNLNSIALICAEHRPENLQEKNVADAKYLISLIKENLTEYEQIDNKKLVEAKITRWETFNTYKNEDSQNPIYKKALEYSKDNNGQIDVDKAGKYILNAEIVESYPESMNIVPNPDVLAKVMEKALYSKDVAIEALCKYDDYQDLSEADKTKILKILEIFDIKSSTDKAVLKNIVENEYVNTDTKVLSRMKENSGKNVTAYFAHEAKQQIIDKYKFPICLEYLAGFEDALSMFATERGTSGIKLTTKNNKSQEYAMEVKLMGHDDRLFSSKNDYRFDVFSEKGLH